MHQQRLGIRLEHALDGGLTTRRRPVIDHPKAPLGRTVGRFRQTVLRLMGRLSVRHARPGKSPSDGRRNGLAVSSTTAQAMAWTTA
jgi:hypothetical protein